MNLLGASIAIALIGVILLANRRWAVMAMMAGVLYLTEYQTIEVLGLNLTAMRLLEVAGMARVGARGELRLLRFNQLDRVFLVMEGYVAIVFLLRSSVGQFEMIGNTVDALFCYFIFRVLIRTPDDLYWLMRGLVVILTPYVALLAIEFWRRDNPFGVMGVGTWNFELRGDRIRGTGSFRHPILLGTLGACLLPLYVAMVFMRSVRRWAAAGAALCLAIVFFANSGGAVFATGLGMAGWLCWFVRTKMTIVRRTLLVVFVGLALVMKAPVWYLPARISDITGGGGWHRSYLMEMAYQHLDLWWIAGLDIAQTRYWFPYVVQATGAADITNAFLYVGFKAGLVAMALFVFLLVRAYQSLGWALRRVRLASPPADDTERLLWGLGCALVVHIAMWFNVTYFDQIHVVWFLQLAAISTISQVTAKASSKPSSHMIPVSTMDPPQSRIRYER